MNHPPSSTPYGPEVAGAPGYESPDALPPLPELPPRNRPLWPPDALERKTEELLREDRVEGLLRVVAKRAERGLPLPEGALTRVLAEPGGGPAARLLERLRRLGRGRPDPAALEVIARHLPHLDAHGALASALGVLGRWAPRDHRATFHAALERSKDWDARLAALEGLLEGEAPEADVLALRLLEATAEPMEADSILPLLVVLGSPETLRRGLRGFAERFSKHEDGPFEVALEWMLQALDSLGFGNGEELRSNVLLVCSAVSSALLKAGCPEVFSPTEDPDARRRAHRLFGKGRHHRLTRLLASDADATQLSLALAKLARQSLADAARKHRPFAPTACRLSTLLDTLVDPEVLDRLDDLDLAALPTVVGVILARAVRGRRPAAEAVEGPLDDARALELLRVDADWLTPPVFSEIAARVGTRDLRKLTGSADPSVRKNAWALLVALAPHKYTARAMKTALYLAFEPTTRLGLAVEYGGDAVLDSVYTELRLQWRRDAMADLLPWLRSVETERAREYLRVHLDLVNVTIRDAVPPGRVLDDIGFLVDPDMAGRVAEAVRTHGVFPDGAEELVPALQGLLDLAGLEVGARAIVDDAVRACPFPGPEPEDADGEPGPFEFGRARG